MSSNKFRLLAIGIVMLGAASAAFACGEDKGTKTSATVASAEGKACCAKGAKATTAQMAQMKKECAAKSGASAVLTSTAGGDHCAAGSKATKASKVAGECTYGENTVTLAGACPTTNEADYAFFVAGAECRGTGAAAAQAVKSVKGVASVTVDYDKHMVYVCADGKSASRKSIEKSLKNAGYDKVRFVNASKQNCEKSHGKVEA